MVSVEEEVGLVDLGFVVAIRMVGLVKMVAADSGVVFGATRGQ